MSSPTVELPCGRSAIPQLKDLKFLERAENSGAIINRLTGAWFGGDREEIRNIFDSIEDGIKESTSLSKEALSAINQSELISVEISKPIFRPHLAVIHVGHVCNIDCTYCYAPKDKGAMPLEVMESVTNIIGEFKHPVFVQFMGGEPLIYLKQIEMLIKLLNEKRQDLETTYGIQTNGLFLLDDGVLDFLKKYKIRFGISYDGPGAMSGARFESRVEKLQNKTELIIRELKAKNYEFGILAVLNRSNQSNLPALLDWCLERGINSLLVNPLLLGQGKGSFHALSDEEATLSMRQLFRYWVDNKLYKKISIENFQAFEDNITNTARPYMCRKQSCGAGREQLAFDVNGDLYPCDYLVGESMFNLGNSSKLSSKKIEHSVHMRSLHEQVRPNKLKDCKECPLFAFCGNCMASSYFRDGSLNGRRGSCHTDYSVIEDVIFELLLNKEYRNHVISR